MSSLNAESSVVNATSSTRPSSDRDHAVEHARIEAWLNDKSPPWVTVGSANGSTGRVIEVKRQNALQAIESIEQKLSGAASYFVRREANYPTTTSTAEERLFTATGFSTRNPWAASSKHSSSFHEHVPSASPKITPKQKRLIDKTAHGASAPQHAAPIPELGALTLQHASSSERHRHQLISDDDIFTAVRQVLGAKPDIAGHVIDAINNISDDRRQILRLRPQWIASEEEDDLDDLDDLNAEEESEQGEGHGKKHDNEAVSEPVDGETSHEQTRRRAAKSSTKASGKSQPSSSSEDRKKRKAKSNEDDDDQKGRKQPKGTPKTGTPEDEMQRRWLCPYFFRFLTTCISHKFRDFAALKQHLDRAHYQTPGRARRADLLMSREQWESICDEPKDVNKTKFTMGSVAHRDKSLTRYLRLWGILFPGVMFQFESPFYEHASGPLALDIWHDMIFDAEAQHAVDRGEISSPDRFRPTKEQSKAITRNASAILARLSVDAAGQIEANEPLPIPAAAAQEAVQPTTERPVLPSRDIAGSGPMQSSAPGPSRMDRLASTSTTPQAPFYLVPAAGANGAPPWNGDPYTSPTQMFMANYTAQPLMPRSPQWAVGFPTQVEPAPPTISNPVYSQASFVPHQLDYNAYTNPSAADLTPQWFANPPNPHPVRRAQESQHVPPQGFPIQRRSDGQVPFQPRYLPGASQGGQSNAASSATVSMKYEEQ